MDSFKKQPHERLDYDIDATEWIGKDRITDAVAVVESRYRDESAPALVLDDIECSWTRVKLWLSGGTSFIDYKITATITTRAGRIIEHEIVIKVREK